VNFPFLNLHPHESELYRTNARKNETLDHIAFFVNKKEKGLPLDSDNATAGSDLNGYDFGVVDFMDLCNQAIHQAPSFSISKTKQNDIYKRVKVDISDHMPIWVRVPIPE